MNKHIVKLLYLFLIIVLCACSGNLGNQGLGGIKETPISIEANIGDDKKAYISTMDGKVIIIKEEVKKAILTADRKNVIVLLEDGTLYYTNKDLTNKKIIDNM